LIKTIAAAIETPPASGELRRFGLLLGGVAAIIGVWPLVFRGEPPRLSVLAVAAMLLLLGAAWPSVLRPLHKVWMVFGHILGWMNTRILLSVIFYGMVTPIGCIRRLMRSDPMNKAFMIDQTTYRVPKHQRPRGHMKFQF
jgi:hypothetical protein